MSGPGLRAHLTTGPWRHRARWAARLITPWGLEWWIYVRPKKRLLAAVEAEVVRTPPQRATRPEDAIRFLVDRGLDETEVREGSMPESSLHFLGDIVADRLPSDRPVRALHVGNFVGVSLCYVSWLVRDAHPDSVVVSIDPNIPHRGIEDPAAHAFALLHHFGLLSTNVVICGYTLEHNVAEGEVTPAEHVEDAACENVLRSLDRLDGQRFDLVLLDGDHGELYLTREFEALRPLLANESIVVFDDVGEWAGVLAVFREALDDETCLELGQDGRVGILQMAPES